MRSLLLKFVALFLIMGLNYSGLLAVSKTFAYLNDTETSSANEFSAGTLDFSLTSTGDFSPPVTPTQSASRDISLNSSGSLDFQYLVRADNFTGDLCDTLDLTANLDGGDVEYNGSLTAFDFDAGQFVASEDWQFTVDLTSDDPSLENQTCDFDFVFDGVQIGGAGFSDREIISNTVNSGAWTTPLPPTTSEYSPIADAYVNQDDSDHNYGSSETLAVKSKDGGSSHENKRTFIRFNFHYPSGVTVNSALLGMYMYDAPGISRTYEAKKVTSTWIEHGSGEIDWDHQPGLGGTMASASSGINPAWLSWNVVSDVQSFVTNPSSNYGWELNDSSENSATSYEALFYSRDATTYEDEHHHHTYNLEPYRPYLQVSFTAQPAATIHLVINEVYPNVGFGKGDEPENEWVEIYNPTGVPVSLDGWRLCDNSFCDTIPSGFAVPAKGFAVITDNGTGGDSTWGYWPTIPTGAVKIALGSPIGGGLSNNGDRVILKDASGDSNYQHTTGVVDTMSYGNDDTYMTLPAPKTGISLARIVKGYDYNSANDWVLNNTPNPGTNPSGDDGMEVMRFTSEGVEMAASEEELAPLVETDAVENNASPSFSETLGAAAGTVAGFISGSQETITTSGSFDNTASPSAESTITPTLELSPEPSLEPSPELIDDPQPLAPSDDSTIQASAEPAIPVEPVIVESPAELVPPPADPPAPPAETLAPAEAPAPAPEAPAAPAE